MNYGCHENDKDIYDGMLRDIALFTDILEVVNIFGMSSAMCFKKAFEGLADGIITDLAINSDVFDDNLPLGELVSRLKKQVYIDKEYVIKNNYFLEE